MITNLLVTAYCACTICCGPKASGLAANGKKPIEGVTCAAARSIPFGTVIYIEGIGKRVVTDRLAKRYDNRIDIYFNNHNKAKQFGITKRKIIYEHKHKSPSR